MDEIEVVLVEPEQLLRRGLLVSQQARVDSATGTDSARHHRQLERIDQHIALADRHVDGVVGLPLAMIFAPHPFGIRDGPETLRSERQIEFLAEPHRANHRGELADPDAAAHLVEIDVAAPDDGVGHVDRSVALVAVEDVVADRVGTRAENMVVAVDAGVEQRHRHHRLDRRSGRVKALGDLVDEWQMVVFRQHLPFVAADPVGEIVGVERGHRRHREDVAIGDVDHHHRSRLVADPPRGILVQIGVDRQLDGAAAAVGLGLQLADQFAPRSDLDPLSPRLSPKRHVERLLEPFLADLEPRDDQQRILVFFLIFLGIGGADIADQLPDGGAARVEAREPTRRRHSGQFGEVDGNGGVFLIRHILCHRHRLEPARVGEVAADPLDFVGAELEQPGQRLDGARDILDLLRDQVDAEARAVDRDRLAVAVDNPAAPRGNGDQLDPVVLAQQRVMLVLRDREIAQPGDQRADDRDLRPADQQHPPREHQRLVRAGEAFLARAEPTLHWPSRQRSSRDTIIPANGKVSVEIRIEGHTVASRTAAPLAAATRHWASSATAMNAAASAHSIQ